MHKVAIITDSTAYLPAELITRYGLHVVPLYVTFGAEVLRDGVDLTDEQFYQKLAAAQELPTTSQPSVGDFLQAYRAAGQEADALLVVTISSALSGTYNSAVTAARETSSDVPIRVIDSRSTSLGLGMIVLAAARAVEAGAKLDEAARLAEGIIPRLHVIFVVDTLKYLQKGGRIGGATALVGSLLQVKPVLFLNDGRVDVLEKPRTRERARQRLIEIIQERVRPDQPVHAAVAHAAAPAEAEALKAQVTSRFRCVEFFTSGVSPAIGTHAGPGTVGLGFYVD
jgi:DegV family protein with EDD domain